jgi:hypothetical protein
METRWLTLIDVDVPHRVTHFDKLDWLVNEFTIGGWDATKPNLLGYALNARIQLVTGSHRSAAAGIVGIRFPVDIYSYSYMRKIWGTDAWVDLIRKHTAA